MNVTEKMEKIVAVTAEATINAAKFEKGNNAAGTRLRANMQELKVLAQDVRTTVTSLKSV